MASQIIVDVLILNTKKVLKEVSFPIDEGMYKAIISQPEERRPKLFAPYYYEYQRQRKYERKVGSIDQVDELRNFAHEVPDLSLDPHQVSLLKERNDLLAKAIKGLRPRERMAVVEVYLKERKQRDVAEEMKIDETTFSKLLSKALAKLKEKLSGKI
jgi:RNA polymerase sigma factor (sigma-70 family)